MKVQRIFHCVKWTALISACGISCIQSVWKAGGKQRWDAALGLLAKACSVACQFRG